VSVCVCELREGISDDNVWLALAVTNKQQFGSISDNSSTASVPYQGHLYTSPFPNNEKSLSPVY